MDLRQLRYFVAIVRAGSISRAAVELGVAQPSLSQRILCLEEELGGPLLVRSSRGVSPTESGQLLLQHAARLLAFAEAAREEVRQCGRAPTGQVAFGLPSSISAVLSVSLIERSAERLPMVSLRIVEALSGHIQRWLEEGSLDLGFLYNLGNLPHLQVGRVLQEDLYLVAAPRHLPQVDGAGIATASLPLREVAALPLVLPSQNHGLRDFIDRSARAAGIHLTIGAELDGLAQIKELVERGRHWSILSLSAIHRELAQGQLRARRIGEPPLSRSVHIVRHPGRPPSRAVQEVEALALELVEDLVRTGNWRAALCRGP